MTGGLTKRKKGEKAMSLIKWIPRTSFLSPFSPGTLANELDRFVDSFFPGALDSTAFHQVDWVPAFDVIEKEKEYVVRVEAPNMKKSDFNITVNDGILTVSGEKKVEESNNGDRYAHRESCYGRFSRSFRLPDDVDEEKNIKGSYKNGVLTVTLPRAKSVDSRAIEVEIS
ncbi:MAG: Hsp20/alpha crystallin family protein [Fidelibacterota bacterium]